MNFLLLTFVFVIGVGVGGILAYMDAYGFFDPEAHPPPFPENLPKK